jgi:hypothetical protein
MSAQNSPPFPVFLATVVGYIVAASLVVFGLIGVAAADKVSDTFGIGLVILGLVVLAATIMLGRGNRLGRLVLAALSALTLIVSVVYAFVGPSYSTGPGFATAFVTLGTIALLYWPQSAKDYFAKQ